MKHTIDTKSLMIGLLLGVSTFLVIAAADTSRNEPNGRYAIAVGGSGVATAFVLDTRTGEVWSSFHGVAPELSSKDRFYAPKLR